MFFIDLYPLKGTINPGETVRFLAHIHSEANAEVVVRLTILHLSEVIATLSLPISLVPGDQRITMKWSPPPNAPRGYGIVCELLDDAGQIVNTTSTAIDVLSAWTEFPRYGFLTDFSPGRDDAETTIESLVRFHINGLQFYDWQYRHDHLVSSIATYVDPLGRELSLTTIRSCINAAHEFGMAAMPYLTVYSASLEFWREHLNWALYDEDGQPIIFMDFLGLMDPTPDGSWNIHLKNECTDALSELPFDGLHVDQYGDPKEAFNIKGKYVDLPGAFLEFVRNLKTDHPDKAVTFNAVGNWPIEALATAPQDFIYIEIWPPKTSYFNLPEIVLGARHLSEGKAVVIALYLPANRLTNVRLADALIFSCGGARIELGEKTRLLSDPYFPKHTQVSPALERILRKYYDFIVRYEELIGPFATDEPNWQVNAPKNIWKMVRTSPGNLTICLVNLRGVEHPNWDEAHPTPKPLRNITVQIATPGSVRKVWWASPDCENLQLQPAMWKTYKDTVRANLPSLEYWSILVVELNDRE